MHRNTYLVVICLAILAALVVGVNIGKKLSPQNLTPQPKADQPLAGTPTPQIIMETYTNNFCGFSLSYPKTFTVLENASGSAILTRAQDKTQSIAIACQKDIPHPPLTADKIESLSFATATGASVSAKLYHDTSSRDGTPIDAVIFRNPKKSIDVFIAGYGEVFNNAIKTIQLLP